MTAIPSREFFVRQAVLNAGALYRDAADTRPLAQSLQSVSWAIKCLISGDYVRPDFVELIRAEHAKLVAQYIEPRAVIASAYADALKNHHGDA